MTRRQWLFGLFFGTAVFGIALQATAMTYRFTVTATGSVLSQTASRLRVNTRPYTGLGLMVVALNGQDGNWVYTINGKGILRSAADQAAYKGDVIEWQVV